MKKIEMYRLIADKGKVLTNGEIEGSVVDVLADKADEWYEIDEPQTENAEK